LKYELPLINYEWIQIPKRLLFYIPNEEYYRSISSVISF
jgi:hypothetical protein